jgi:hypothetical protein
VFRALLYLTALTAVGLTRLCAEPDVKVERMSLHQFEDGPLLPDSYEYLPGETAYFSCRLSGYQVEPSGDDRRLVKLSWKLDVLDPSGVPIDPPKAGRIEDRLSPQDKEWIPKFLASFMVPPFALPGNYRISVQAKDEIAGNEAKADLTFRVRAHEVAPSDTVVARNFRFLSSEDDAIGTRSGLYHPGETVWAHFDVTGYKFEANTRFSVDCGLAVETADGKQLFSQPEAASQSTDTFYPQRYVPITLNVSLDKNVRPATYILIVTLRDNIAHLSSELREPFLVQ